MLVLLDPLEVELLEELDAEPELLESSGGGRS
jgi:hypothetical protein